MDFIADECVDGHVIKALAEAGHVVRSIRDTDPGSTDEQVLMIAHGRACILITEDKDFGDLVFARNAEHTGVVLIRLDGFPPPGKVARVMMAIGHHIQELPGAFTVIDKNKVRIRKRL